MAVIHEMFDSRTGASRGVDGISNENRLFSVTAEDSDIVEVPDGLGGTLSRELPDPRGLLALSGLANIGTQHPWDLTARCHTYSIVQRRTTRNWLVQAQYVRDTAVALPTTQGWLPTIRGTSVTKRLLVELLASESSFRAGPSGGGAPTPIGGATPVASSLPKRIGPTRFVKVAPESAGDAPFYSHEVDANGVRHTVYLKATESRKVVGFNADWPAFELNLTRILPTFHVEQSGGIMADFMKAVNDRRFRGADPGHVLVQNITIDPLDMNVQGQAVEGLAWRATISLLWSSIPWTPWSIYPAHVDDEGNESQVLHHGGADNGEPVIEHFRVRRTRNLYALQAALEGS